MELFTDLKSRLAFRSGGKPNEERSGGVWEQLEGSSRVLTAVIDRSGKIQAANKALCRLREAEQGDVVGTSLSYLIHAEDRTGFQEMVREAQSDPTGASGGGRLLAAGDRVPMIHWILIPTAGAEGVVEAVSCLGVDVSGYLDGGDLRKVEGELVELRRELTAAHKENEALRKDLQKKAAAPAPGTPAPIPPEEDLPEGSVPVLEEGERLPSLAELERRYILHVLEGTKGRVSGRKGAAAILGLHPNTLRSRMAKHGIGK